MHINRLGPRCSNMARVRDRTRTGNAKDRPSSPESWVLLVSVHLLAWKPRTIRSRASPSWHQPRLSHFIDRNTAIILHIARLTNSWVFCAGHRLTISSQASRPRVLMPVCT